MACSLTRLQKWWLNILGCFVMLEIFLLVNNYKQGPTTIDKRSYWEIQSDIERKIYRNLPMDELLDPKKSKFWHRQRRCGLFPRFFDIKFTNTYWQKLNTTNGTVMLHAAYYDDRLPETPIVWVLGAGRVANQLPRLFCHLWFNAMMHPVEVNVTWSKHLHGDNVFQHWHPEVFLGHLIKCQIPEEYKEQVPSVVSMVSQSCGRSFNALKVTNNKMAKMQDFAVCLKGLWSPFQENHVQVAEWIEMNLAVGASKVIIYVFAVAPKTRKILAFYERMKKVEVLQMEWAGSMPTSHTPLAQEWFYQNVSWIYSNFEDYAHSDCFYRNLYTYKFVALIDIDELIMPAQHSTWQEVFQELKRQGVDPSDYTSLFFQHYDFFGNRTTTKTSSFQLLDSDLRAATEYPYGWQDKGMFNTQKANIVFNHDNLGCIEPPCRSVLVNATLGKLNHYGSNCTHTEVLKQIECLEMKNNLVMDNLAIKRYGTTIKMNVHHALQSIEESDSIPH
ncbi:hypothetical protein TCAL_06357 [Tigriopus californicus]|uniref:Glycosyltransferase family 92 protein n=2 Tax=Tigriopus californicus TaxID=6832 RepID=A0A553PRR3_TIGCA|nr:uncharacterized protein LOC131891836 isoform X1 [Tigriopus californicus]TRY80378.1 hypothetical protein TCAL_06357 [Tigriopus californicus]